MRIRRKKRSEKTEMQQTIDRLDDLWSELIRKRALLRKDHGCEKCTRWKEKWQYLQAAHNFTRSNRTTQWDPRNGAGLCGGCHSYLDRHPDVKEEFFRKLIGDDEYEMLYILTNMTTKQAPVDYKATEIALRYEIKELATLLAAA